MKRTRTGQIIRDDRAHVWHPFTWMPGYLAEEPLVITGAKGIHLIAADGRRYMDGISSMWLNVHGHNRPEIIRAIAAQAKRFAHVSVFGQTHAPAAELARRLVGIAPKGLNRVFFSDDGATAVEVALKLAFQYAQIRGETRRTKFLALRHAYHGDTLGAVAAGDIEHFHHTFKPLLAPCLRAPSPSCVNCDLGSATGFSRWVRCPAPSPYPSPPRAGERGGRIEAAPSHRLKPVAPANPETPTGRNLACLGALEAVLKRHAKELCAFIVEPIVQGAAGMLVAAAGYLRGARELCTKYRVPLIADEVFVGFGRTGRMFACEHERVTPDILCLAKGLTGGTLPLAATLATDEIYEAFLGQDRVACTFFHGHSYTANPLGCAAALASLDLFEKDRTLARVRRLERVLAKESPRFAELPGASGVRYKGAIFALDLAKGAGRRACAAAQKEGLLIRPLGDTVYLVPPLTTTEKQLREMLDILYDSIQEARQ